MSYLIKYIVHLKFNILELGNSDNLGEDLFRVLQVVHLQFKSVKKLTEELVGEISAQKFHSFLRIKSLYSIMIHMELPLLFRSPFFSSLLTNGNYFFTAIFAFESFIKLAAMSPRYFFAVSTFLE